jgi:hypothetical protein
MKNHEELFKALIDRKELVNKFNGKTLKINESGDAVLISKNWHNFNPSEWEINKPEEDKGERIAENKN